MNKKFQSMMNIGESPITRNASDHLGPRKKKQQIAPEKMAPLVRFESIDEERTTEKFNSASPRNTNLQGSKNTDARLLTVQTLAGRRPSLSDDNSSGYNTSESSQSDQSKYFLNSPIPILAKSKKDYLIPPKCPLEQIKFIQLF